MNIAEWLNEVPGRRIVITGGHSTTFDDWVDHPDFVKFMAISPLLGKKAACVVNVSDSLFSDIEDVGGFVTDNLQTSIKSLIFSFKDRN